MEGITSVDQASHPINHIGVKYRSIFNNRAMVFYSSSFSQSNDDFSYSETDEKKTMEIHFALKSLEENKTLLVIDYYVRKNPFTQLFFPLFLKNKLSRQFAKSLHNMEELCQRPGIKKAMIDVN